MTLFFWQEWTVPRMPFSLYSNVWVWMVSWAGQRLMSSIVQVKWIKRWYWPKHYCVSDRKYLHFTAAILRVGPPRSLDPSSEGVIVITVCDTCAGKILRIERYCRGADSCRDKEYWSSPIRKTDCDSRQEAIFVFVTEEEKGEQDGRSRGASDHLDEDEDLWCG